MDILYDELSDGRRFRILAVVDAYTSSNRKPDRPARAAAAGSKECRPGVGGIADSGLKASDADAIGIGPVHTMGRFGTG